MAWKLKDSGIFAPLTINWQETETIICKYDVEYAWYKTYGRHQTDLIGRTMGTCNQVKSTCNMITYFCLIKFFWRRMKLTLHIPIGNYNQRILNSSLIHLPILNLFHELKTLQEKNNLFIEQIYLYYSGIKV